MFFSFTIWAIIKASIAAAAAATVTSYAAKKAIEKCEDIVHAARSNQEGGGENRQ